MMSLNEWKELAMYSFIILTIMLISAYIILTIVAKIKNKAQKKARKQITRKAVKFDLCDYLVRNMKQDYIGYSKVIRNELARM